MSDHKHNSIDYVEFSGKNSDSITQIKNFYSDAFGWKFNEWGASYIDTDSSGIACGFDATSIRAPLAVIYSDNLENSYAIIKDLGGIITREILSFPGGRRLHFRDPAGNELAVWSDK